MNLTILIPLDKHDRKSCKQQEQYLFDFKQTCWAHIVNISLNASRATQKNTALTTNSNFVDLLILLVCPGFKSR